MYVFIVCLEILVLGLGDQSSRLDVNIHNFLRSKGIAVEIQSTVRHIHNIARSGNFCENIFLNKTFLAYKIKIFRAVSMATM
jgi:hypothetical protein